MKVLQDKQELKERNAAYKVTLKYCEETCDDVDTLFFNVGLMLTTNDFTLEQQVLLNDLLRQLNDDIKNVGTRKLRKAFTDYVLESMQESK